MKTQKKDGNEGVAVDLMIADVVADAVSVARESRLHKAMMARLMRKRQQRRQDRCPSTMLLAGEDGHPTNRQEIVAHCLAHYWYRWNRSDGKPKDVVGFRPW